MKMSTQKSLEDFASHLNWATLGRPEDMERFWDFVIAAYRNNDPDIALDDFLARVKYFQPKEENMIVIKKRLNFLIFLFSKYEDGITLLKKIEKV